MALQEMLLIFGVLLLLFGGQKLPQLASGMGKAIREFRRASTSNDKEVGDPAALPEIIAPRS